MSKAIPKSVSGSWAANQPTAILKPKDLVASQLLYQRDANACVSFFVDPARIVLDPPANAVHGLKFHITIEPSMAVVFVFARSRKLGTNQAVICETCGKNKFYWRYVFVDSGPSGRRAALCKA